MRQLCLGIISCCVLALAMGCADDNGGPIGFGGSGGDGAGGTGMGGSGGGMGGSGGGMGGTGGSAVPTGDDLVDAIDALLAEGCLCVPVDERPICMANSVFPYFTTVENDCIGDVVDDDEGVAPWLECLLTSTNDSTQCVMDITPMCDPDGIDDCNEERETAIDACETPGPAAEAAFGACLAAGGAKVFDSFESAAVEFCACDETPVDCEMGVIPPTIITDCLIAAIDDGLADSETADATQEAASCQSRVFRQWEICLEAVDACDEDQRMGCNDAYDPGSDAAMTCNTLYPEAVESEIEACTE